jgi:hypothetical protein
VSRRNLPPRGDRNNFSALPRPRRTNPATAAPPGDWADSFKARISVLPAASRGTDCQLSEAGSSPGGEPHPAVPAGGDGRPCEQVDRSRGAVLEAPSVAEAVTGDLVDLFGRHAGRETDASAAESRSAQMIESRSAFPLLSTGRETVAKARPAMPWRRTAPAVDGASTRYSEFRRCPGWSPFARPGRPSRQSRAGCPRRSGRNPLP